MRSYQCLVLLFVTKFQIDNRQKLIREDGFENVPGFFKEILTYPILVLTGIHH